MRDVAKVELGAQGYDQACTLDGQPSVALSVYQRPGSNALATAELVKDKMKELKERFPDGIDYSIVYDTTPFITESVSEVFKTLRDAVILVAFVVLLFLQNWRSALIPLVAVPVAIVGTFAVMAALGFSLNNLTLFGLVLAIGIVVDDAIVVVEAVEHHIELGLAPRDATIKAMSQVSAPVIAVGLVLTAVFVPCAFITGITGQFYRQFALTIATSTVISAFNSLTLSPALAALLLRPRVKGVFQALPWPAFVAVGGWAGYAFLGPQLLKLSQTAGLHFDSPWVSLELAANLVGMAVGAIAGYVVSGVLNRAFGWTFYLFNRAFDASTSLYTKMVAGLLRVSVLVLLIYGGSAGADLLDLHAHADRLHPRARQGVSAGERPASRLVVAVRTQQVMKNVELLASKLEGVSHTMAIAGQSILMNANAPNFGAMYVMLDEFHHRAHARAYRARRSPRSFRASCKTRSGTVWSTSSTRRRSTGWAPPADSRSWCKTAATWVRMRSRPSPTGSSTESQIAGKFAAASGALHELSRQYAVALPRHRPRQGQAGGGFDLRAVQHPSGLPGLALRQRLQPVRPHLAGQRPGRCQFPQAVERPDRSQGAQLTRGHGPAWDRSPRSAT